MKLARPDLAEIQASFPPNAILMLDYNISTPRGNEERLKCEPITSISGGRRVGCDIRDGRSLGGVLLDERGGSRLEFVAKRAEDGGADGDNRRLRRHGQLADRLHGALGGEVR